MIVVLGLPVGADFAAKAFAQSKIATQIQKQGFPTKPSVSIAGFPFLTQVISHNLQQITISSSNIPAGPITITSLSAVLDGVHVNSGFSGGTVSRLHGMAFISFRSLSGALKSQGGGIAGAFVGGSSLKLTPVGNNEVRASLNLVITTASATWQISRPSGHEINARLVSSNGLPSSLLSSVSNINIPLSALPMGLELQSITVATNGITAKLTGQSLSFGG